MEDQIKKLVGQGEDSKSQGHKIVKAVAQELGVEFVGTKTILHPEEMNVKDKDEGGGLYIEYE